MDSIRPPSTSDKAYLTKFVDDYDNDDDHDDGDEDWEVSMTDWVNNVDDLITISSTSNPPLRPGPSTRTQPADQPKLIVEIASTTASTATTATTPYRFAAALTFAQQYPQ